jgi:hypothetical protein
MSLPAGLPKRVWITMEPNAPDTWTRDAAVAKVVVPKTPGPVALNPVAIAWAVNLGVAMLAGFGLNLTGAQVGAVTTVAAALVAVVTAATSRPWFIPGITGAATAALTAGVAFGLDWTPEQIGAATTALSVVLMLVTHQSVIPAAAAKRGLTATEILLARLVAAQSEPVSAPALNLGPRRRPGQPDPLPPPSTGPLAGPPH